MKNRNPEKIKEQITLGTRRLVAAGGMSNFSFPKLSAERHSNYEDKDKKGNYLRCERSYGSYARSFDISGIDAAGIKAAYADGVLRVTLPKQKEVPASSRRLEIE